MSAKKESVYVVRCNECDSPASNVGWTKSDALWMAKDKNDYHIVDYDTGEAYCQLCAYEKGLVRY